MKKVIRGVFFRLEGALQATHNSFLRWEGTKWVEGSGTGFEPPTGKRRGGKKERA